MHRSLFLRSVAVLLGCVYVFGQTATGVLQGTVTDASGAAVPDAKVVIENQRTGVKQTLTTNTEGRFVQPFLIPSEYRVSVEKAGFQQYVTSNVRLDVQQTISLDIPLKVGELSASVEVQADTAQLSTSTSSVSTVIQNKMILDMPMNGRNAFSLANGATGVIPASGSTPWISGGRNASSDITVDGASIILPENNTGILQLGYTPIVDSIEEFTVITNALAAEYGRTGGGVINVATRSGTNALHITLFEFLRNSQLDANTWSNNRNGAPRTTLQRNEFGGTAGGPVVSPHLYNGKNRTFFFFSEQSVRALNGASSTATMPIDAWRTGDFSDLRNGAGARIALYDPLLTGSDNVRQPFDENKIPMTRFNTVAKNILQYFPKPNARPTNTFTFQNNYFLPGKSPSENNKFDSRLDQNFSAKFRLWPRGPFRHSFSSPFNGFANIGTSSADGPANNYNYNVAVNAVYTINATTILNINYGVGRRNLVRLPFSRGIDIRTLGFPQSIYDVAVTTRLWCPPFHVAAHTKISSPARATITTPLYRHLAHDAPADTTKALSKTTIQARWEFRKLFLTFPPHCPP